MEVENISDCLRLKLNDECCLSRRQSQVLREIVDGKTAREIGENLGISSKTVETYTDQLKIVFGCSKKLHLIHSVHSQNLYEPLLEINMEAKIV